MIQNFEEKKFSNFFLFFLATGNASQIAPREVIFSIFLPQFSFLNKRIRSTDSNEEDLGAAADDNFDDFDANEKKKKKPKKKMKMKSIPLERRGKTNEKEEEGAKRKKRDEDLEEADDEEPLKGKRVKKPTAAKKPSVQGNDQFRLCYTLFLTFLVPEEYSLPQLVMRYGSKPAHLLHWIHKLLASNQDARVIIFARVSFMRRVTLVAKQSRREICHSITK